MLVSMLSLSDLIFSGGGDTDGGSDDEGSAVANSVMHASADGDRGVWRQIISLNCFCILSLMGTDSSVFNRPSPSEVTAEGTAGARCSSPHPSKQSSLLSSSSV
ncbi:hypothetical protein Tco_0411828 [Tanacetum coccineum]